MANVFKEAKRLWKQPKNRKKKWASMVKEAGRLVKKKNGKRKPAKKSARRKVGATKYVERNESRSARPSKVYRVRRKKSGTYNGVQRLAGVATGSLVSQAKKNLTEEIGWLEAMRFSALKNKKKSVANGYSKKIAEKKRLYNKLT